MGGSQQPFMYENVRTNATFDPKSVSRASFQVKPQRHKHDGPLVSFNAHPDSYMVVPTGITTAPMKGSTKKWIKWLRIVQLALRALCLVGGLGLLVVMIILRGMDESIGWLMRIAPGVAVVHSLYGVYHLSRKASGRTPASSASYMLFASFFDVSLIPCYAFSALVTYTKSQEWRSIVDNQDLTPKLIKVAFYTYSVAGGLHAITLGLAINLAVTFRRITQLPPDMNPLEDNLTSRHKRNKSSMSTITTESSFTKRGSAISEKRAPANAYEDFRQPTIPFFHTRQQSTDSFSTYRSTPPPSRDSRDSLPNRPYGLDGTASPRLSVSDLMRNPYYSEEPSQSRTSFADVPLSDNHRDNARPDSSRHSLNTSSTKTGAVNDAWFTSNSLNSPKRGAIQKQGLKGGQYQPVTPYDDDMSTLSMSSSQSSRSNRNTYPLSQAPHNQNQPLPNKSALRHSHPNPVASNPPTPNRTRFPGSSAVTTNSPLSEVSTNKRSISITKESSTGGDIADNLMANHQNRHTDKYDVSDEEDELATKSKGYGALKAGKPPVMVGNGKLGLGSGIGNRQVSSGTDFVSAKNSKRDVSGKVAEEGRANPWGARLRKVSGILQ